MSADRSTIVHATTVACQGSAVLLRGAPGAGKSDLALRLLTSCQTPILASPFMLVADDQTVLRRDGSRLVASPPETLAGLLEVRGVGIVPLPFAAEAVVALVAHVHPPNFEPLYMIEPTQRSVVPSTNRVTQR